MGASGWRSGGSEQPAVRISSPRNRWIKWARELGSKKSARRHEGLTLIEGRHLLAEALSAGVALPHVFFHPAAEAEEGDLLRSLEQAGSRLWRVSETALASCAQTETPQGVVAVAAWQEKPFPPEGLAPSGELVLLAGVQDPGNVGTIARATYAAGLRGLLAGPGTAELSSPKVMRAGAGALFRLPAWRLTDWTPLERMREAGWRVVAADVRGSLTPAEVQLTGGVILALGSEAHGCPQEVLRLSDASVCIPMPGGAESLNVAMAAAVFLYEMVRQRQSGHRL